MIIPLALATGPANENLISKYRVVDKTGHSTSLLKSEVEMVMDWEDEDAAIGDFTHMQRFNSRKQLWITVVAWDERFAVRLSDAETAHHLATV